MFRLFGCLIGMALGLHAYGATYYRCADARGHVTFSQIPCGPDAEKAEVETRPGPRRQRSVQQQLRRMQQIGRGSARSKRSTRKTDACAGVSRIELRNARVGRRIMVCHSQDDILTMLGEPSSREAWSSGGRRSERWRYRFGDGRRVTVDFEDGLVRRWRGLAGKR